MSSTKSVIHETKYTPQLRSTNKETESFFFKDFGHIMRRENSLENTIILGMRGGTRKRKRQTTSTMKACIMCITECTLNEL